MRDRPTSSIIPVRLWVYAHTGVTRRPILGGLMLGASLGPITHVSPSVSMASPLTVSSPLPSQSPASGVATLMHSLDHIQDSLATITTDTGAFAPGDKNFSHYQVPGLCLTAARNTLFVLRRSLAASEYVDSIEKVAPERETVPAPVTTIARACGAHFTVAGTAVHDLPDLFDLALFEGNDALARAALDRRVALQSGALDRDTVLQTAIGWYLTAQPARVAAAETTVMQVEALGGRQAQQLSWSLAAHEQLLRYAEATSEWPLLRREAEQMLTLSYRAPGGVTNAVEDDYVYQAVILAYEKLTEADVVEHPDSLYALAQQVQQALRHVHPRGQEKYQTFADVPRDTMLKWLVPTSLSGAIHGQHADSGLVLPPLTATFWYPARPAHWPPGAGPVSMIVRPVVGGDEGVVRDACLYYDQEILSSWTIHCYGGLVRSVRQWTALYGSKLAITILVPTRGRAIRSILLPPASEADTLAWYFRDYLKLPVTVAVVESAVRQEPHPRDVLRYTDTALVALDYIHKAAEDYQEKTWDFDPPILLLTRTGHLLYAGGVSPLLDLVLARAMGKATASAPVSADDSIAKSTPSSALLRP